MSVAVWREFARIGFLQMLAFRLRYYTGVITYFINVCVYYFIWKAIFAANPGFAGFSFPQMMTYVAVGWVIRSLYFNNIDTEMASDILEGKISMTMLKPVRVQTTYIARAIGEAGFRLLLLTLPTALVVSWLFPVQPPASVGALLFFLVSLIGSVLLVAAINFCIGACAVKLKSILGLIRAKFWMQELLSGLLIPVALFPAPLRAVSGWLPFQHVGYTPVMIYLGKLQGAAMAQALLIEWAWVGALIVGGHWFWLRISRHITIQGG